MRLQRVYLKEDDVDKKYPPTAAHNFMPKLRFLMQTCKAGEIKDIQVSHDDYCDIYKKKFCNCEPEVKAITTPPKNKLN